MRRQVLHKFYAVTATSIYLVKDRTSAKNPLPVARKIALRGVSGVALGEVLVNGTMIAITDRVQTYIPEGGGITSFQRRIENVNTRYWGGHSSPIVALFTSERRALGCLHAGSLVPCDRRWIEETRAVIALIGDEHPSFYVCRFPRLSLIPNS